MDDVALELGRIGFALGAVLGLILGITVWHSWLISAIVMGFYGTIIGGLAGMAIGLLSRRR